MRWTDDPCAVVLDLDQAELALNPTRTRVWAPVGVPWEVETPGNNAKQVAFGAVNDLTGQTHFALMPHKRSEDFQRFVDHEILPCYSNAEFICLIIDGAKIYSSKSTKQWLAKRPQVVLVPLPTYAPKLNLQELIWRWMRSEVTHNHYFVSLSALLTAARRFFAKLDEHTDEVLRRIGRAFPDGLMQHHLATFP
jgi:hypothetical protein